MKIPRIVTAVSWWVSGKHSNMVTTLFPVSASYLQQRETGTAMYWVSGKHSTKGMMEMMLFAAVLKLR